jgi:4-alpha-glucanotransferase
MAILQFAFGDDPQAPSFRPHNYARDLVAYTGTHDNDTAAGWWESGAGDSVRTAEQVAREKAFARAYLGGGDEPMGWTLIRAVMASVADTAVFPLQDVLGLGAGARMNRPATLGGNWAWRCDEAGLRAELAARLAELSRLYDR